jgi:hypothetical protein
LQESRNLIREGLLEEAALATVENRAYDIDPLYLEL